MILIQCHFQEVVVVSPCQFTVSGIGGAEDVIRDVHGSVVRQIATGIEVVLVGTNGLNGGCKGRHERGENQHHGEDTCFGLF